MKKGGKTVLPRLPEVDFEALPAFKLEAMIDQAVAMPQMGKSAEVMMFRRPGFMWGGIGALAASVVLAVALTPAAPVVSSNNDLDDFSYMVVVDSLDS